MLSRILATVTVISIHAPREGGDLKKEVETVKAAGISIHAPREGGDKGVTNINTDKKISIHAPREGGDRPSLIALITK